MYQRNYFVDSLLNINSRIGFTFHWNVSRTEIEIKKKIIQEYIESNGYITEWDNRPNYADIFANHHELIIVGNLKASQIWKDLQICPIQPYYGMNFSEMFTIIREKDPANNILMLWGKYYIEINETFHIVFAKGRITRLITPEIPKDL